MDILKQICIETLSNLVWVILVFVVLYIRDRAKKQQIARCQDAYLLYLLKSTAVVRNNIYPYIYLIKIGTHQGNIVPTLLSSIYELTANLLQQTQEVLGLIESAKLQQKILQLYQKIILFQANVSQSQVDANVIVGNPVELVEPPRQQQEIKIYQSFVGEFHSLVKEIYHAFPDARRENIPKDIEQLLDQKTPLQALIDGK